MSWYLNREVLEVFEDWSGRFGVFNFASRRATRETELTKIVLPGFLWETRDAAPFFCGCLSRSSFSNSALDCCFFNPCYHIFDIIKNSCSFTLNGITEICFHRNRLADCRWKFVQELSLNIFTLWDVHLTLLGCSWELQRYQDRHLFFRCTKLNCHLRRDFHFVFKYVYNIC